MRLEGARNALSGLLYVIKVTVASDPLSSGAGGCDSSVPGAHEAVEYNAAFVGVRGVFIGVPRRPQVHLGHLPRLRPGVFVVSARLRGNSEASLQYSNLCYNGGVVTAAGSCVGPLR